MGTPLILLILTTFVVATCCMNANDTSSNQEHDIERLIARLAKKGYGKDVVSKSGFKFDANCGKCQVEYFG